MSLKRLLFPGVAALLLCAWAAFEFSPGRQLERAFDRLIGATENRDWKKVGKLMADDYRDQWGQNREEAVNTGSQILRHFIAFEIVVDRQSVEREGRQATISARLRLEGRGTAIAEMVMQGANALQDDFQFAWRRKSWKSWDWKLVSVNQPEIEFDPSMLP